MRDSGITLRLGDITRVAADAIVNASNAQLAPGGPSLAEEGRAWVEAHGPLAPGEAAVTGGGDLPARHVIHALGPVWHGGHGGEAEALASAYRNAIGLADGLGATTVAFPSISTGIFGYPVAAAARVAVDAVRGALASAAHVREVVFVLFDEATFRAYEAALAES